MSVIKKKIGEFLHIAPLGGTASPTGAVFYETADIPLADIMKLYERDPTCKSSIDLLAASTVGMGFYTTVDEDYEKAAAAKAAVDDFNEAINLDGLLNDMAVRLIGCGNDFWLKSTPSKLTDLVRMPIDAVEKINLTPVGGVKIPYKAASYRLKSSYRDGESNGDLDPAAVLHWHIHQNVSSGFGVGLLQVLLFALCLDDKNKRPAYAAMKAKIERIMPKIFEKYAGPDVLAILENADDKTLAKFQKAIQERPEEGAWLFYNKKGDVKPVTLDPRAQGFVYYVDHILNQFYLGCETPLPRLFSTPGFTEASANAALELQEMLIKPIQRYVKRQVESEIFASVLSQNGFDPVKAKVRLNWSASKAPQPSMADLLKAAELNLIRQDEFRKNAVKFGWQLWDAAPQRGQGN